MREIPAYRLNWKLLLLIILRRENSAKLYQWRKACTEEEKPRKWLAPRMATHWLKERERERSWRGSFWLKRNWLPCYRSLPLWLQTRQRESLYKPTGWNMRPEKQKRREKLSATSICREKYNESRENINDEAWLYSVKPRRETCMTEARESRSGWLINVTIEKALLSQMKLPLFSF